MNAKEIIESGKDTVVYRTGEARKLLPPVAPLEKQKLNISGVIGTISEFLSKRVHLYEKDECNIQINENDGIMIFSGNECQNGNEHVTTVVGKLIYSRVYGEFNINDDHYETAADLAKYLRKRKPFFTDSEQFSKVWLALSSFNAEVNRQIKDAGDNKGNIHQEIRQEVTSNLPNEFSMSMKVFKNAPEIQFNVEIDVDPNNLSCTMISFDLDEKIENQKKQIFDAELGVVIRDETNLKDFCVVYYC